MDMGIERRRETVPSKSKSLLVNEEYFLRFSRLCALKVEFVEIERFWEFVFCVVFFGIKGWWSKALFIFEEVAFNLAVAALVFFFVVVSSLIGEVGAVGFIHLIVRVLEILFLVPGWFLILSVGSVLVLLGSGDVLRSRGEPYLQRLEFIEEFLGIDTEEVAEVLVGLFNWTIVIPSPSSVIWFEWHHSSFGLGSNPHPICFCDCVF